MAETASVDGLRLPGALRRERIAAVVAERGFVRVTELADRFRTSTVTIRGDLDALADRGLVRRVHGGAVASDAPAAASVALPEPLEAKAAIGVVAAAMVEPGQTVMMAGGTTMQAVARALAHRDDLDGVTVVTNGLLLALELQQAIPRITVIVTGGTLLGEVPMLADPLADVVLRDLQADLAITGCRGISAGGGVTDHDLPHLGIGRRLLTAGRRRVVVADASKVGLTTRARFWPVEAVDVLVTERGADAGAVAELRAAGVDVRLAAGGANDPPTDDAGQGSV